MAHSWTAAQQAAISLRGHELLVSAAAGSGKTAALTERIIGSLTREDDPADITRILAVTFTRASAAELRRRISSALSERIEADPQNTRLVRQLMLLGSAKICTIDAFCGDVVRANFQRLPLPAGFRIPDDTELKLLKRSVMEEVIDRRYAAGNASFAALADCLTGNKNDAALSKLFIDIYNELLNLPDGVKYLEGCTAALLAEAEKDFYSGRAGSVQNRYLTEELSYYGSFFADACDELRCDPVLTLKYYPAFEADLNFCRDMLRQLALNNYGAAYGTAQLYSPVSLRSPGKAKSERTEALKKRRTKIKNALASTLRKYFGQSPEAVKDSYIRTAELCGELYNTISQFENNLCSEKLARGICDFDDIRRYAVQLLIGEDGCPTDIARDYAERFDEIFIDEYQDVTLMQDMLFRAVSNGHNRFMVGDIKQSIYGFRGAEPSLFADYRAAYPSYDAPHGENDGLTVFMSENFRCDKNIIDFVNLICPRIFRACGDSVGYVSGDNLVFAKLCDENYSSPRVSVNIITAASPADTAELGETPTYDAGDTSAVGGNTDSDDDADDDADGTETDFIAAEISRLLHGECRADGKALRPGDIAVLCRAKSTCGKVSGALSAAGIPVVSDLSRGYFKKPEVMLMISLLTVIDNPQKDIPLAAVLRSPLFGFTMDELSQIRSFCDKSASLFDCVISFSEGDGDLSRKCRLFCDKLTAYRGMARALPADRLLRGIYRDTAALSLAGGDGSGRGDLLRLYEYARQFEAGSFKGLYNFIRYVNNAVSGGSEGDTPAAEPGQDAVTVITIHHSKGLEFPVCFLCGCAKRFNMADTQSDLIFDTVTGPTMYIKDATGLAKLNTPLRQAAAMHTKRSQTEEEMRLLYVAMTRARERLYLTAQCLRGFESKLEGAALEKEIPGSFPILNAGCYLDWLLPALSDSPPSDAPYTFNVISRADIPAAIPYMPDADDTPKAYVFDSAEYAAELEKRFTYVYPYEHLTRLPAKLSVSKLYPGMLDGEEDGESSPDVSGNTSVADSADAESNTVPSEQPLASRTFTPEFLAGSREGRVTSAERGTATHVFLQFCDFSRCERNGISDELSRLTEERFIPRCMAELVNVRQLEAFFRSEFYALLRHAREVWREQRFNILLPAATFTEDSGSAERLAGEELLVQGVIDIFFTDSDGRLILCDYKTDYLTPGECADPQLAASKLSERHRTQLSYYAAALARIFGRRPDRTVIYSLPLGGTVDISVDII